MLVSVWTPLSSVVEAIYLSGSVKFLLLPVQWLANPNCSSWMKVSNSPSHASLLMRFLFHTAATSAIDYKTDAVIQSSIRHELKRDVTLIIVAHRLQTIMDADKIVRNSLKLRFSLKLNES